MKIRSIAAIAAVLLGAVAAGIIGTASGSTPGKPAQANRPTVGQTPLPSSTPYRICGLGPAESWRC